MRELSLAEAETVAAGLRIKLHFNIIQAVFTVIGAGILGGPVGAGMAVAAAIGTQGAGNLVDLYNQENGANQ
jgi:hypothetical protein